MAFTVRGTEKFDSDQTLDPFCDIVLFDTTAGPLVVTLPSPTLNDSYTIKNIGMSGNNLTVKHTGIELDGDTADAVLSDLDTMRVVGDGTKWWIVVGGSV